MALPLSGKVSRRWQIISVRSLFGCQETKFNMKREKEKREISAFRNRMWHKHWRGVMATGSACCFIARKDHSIAYGSTWQPWDMFLKKKKKSDIKKPPTSADFPDDGLSVAVASAAQDLKSRRAYATLFFFCVRLSKKQDFSVGLPTQPCLIWSGPTTPLFRTRSWCQECTNAVQYMTVTHRHSDTFYLEFALSVSVWVVSCYFILRHFFSFLVNFHCQKDCCGPVELIGFIRASQKSNWTAPSFGRSYPATNDDDFSK